MEKSRLSVDLLTTAAVLLGAGVAFWWPAPVFLRKRRITWREAWTLPYMGAVTMWLAPFVALGGVGFLVAAGIAWTTGH